MTVSSSVIVRQSMMFWSDITTDTIHRANMDGSEEEVLVNTDLISVGEFLYTTHTIQLSFLWSMHMQFEKSILMHR